MEKTGAVLRKILVMEDEPAISQICRRVLEGEGFEVNIAVDGSAAQELLGENDYDLALIDLRTPGMNGKEFYHWIKERHPALINKVIFTTGNVLGGDIKSFLEQAQRPFLPKPFTPNELTAVVRETLKQTEK
jgi:DNA-binding response OmpR family regulator